jgi:hypothetical protein
MKWIWILTYEYSDKSGFHVYGVTDNHLAAKAWMDGSPHSVEQKAYKMEINTLVQWYKPEAK